MLVYPSSIDQSSRTLRFLTGRLAVRRAEIGTRWRRLTAGRQALPALAHLRCGGTYAQLAAGFGIGIATAYRSIREAVEILAALAPTPAEAMRVARTKAFVILDGTLLPIGRIASDTPYCSGKHKRHGMNVQVLTDLLVTAEAPPPTAARHALGVRRKRLARCCCGRSRLGGAGWRWPPGTSQPMSKHEWAGLLRGAVNASWHPSNFGGCSGKGSSCRVNRRGGRGRLPESRVSRARPRCICQSYGIRTEQAQIPEVSTG